MNQNRNLVVKIKNQIAKRVKNRRETHGRRRSPSRSLLRPLFPLLRRRHVPSAVSMSQGIGEDGCPMRHPLHRCLSIDIEMQLSICQVGKWTAAATSASTSTSTSTERHQQSKRRHAWKNALVETREMLAPMATAAAAVAGVADQARPDPSGASTSFA